MPMATPDERIRAYKQSFIPVQKLLDGGRFPDALAELERVTAANPDCAQAHNDLAVLYHAAGRLSDADRESRRAVELDPFHVDIRENRDAIVAALAAANAGGIPAAATTPATAVRPPVTPALDGSTTYRDALRRAEDLLAAGKLDAAVAEIERFVEGSPATAEAWNDLGVLHRDAGRLQAAHAALTVALTIDPVDRQAAHNMTRVLLEMGRHQEALRALEPTLVRNPRDVDALTLAGDISLGLRQNSDASAFYRAALTVEPTNLEVAVKLAEVASASPQAPVSIHSYAPPPAPARPATPTVTLIPSLAPATGHESPRTLEYDPRVRLVTSDATYDTVTCKIPLDRLPDPIAALTEMTRILRPGGKLWIELGGPLEIIKPAVPRFGAESTGIGTLPAARAR